jgi:two-component system cell cycle sensor histidine kinase/response regulator CckA
MRDDAVIVVEDDPMAAQAVTAMLESKFGGEIEVLSADCISRAEELLREAPVSCVFLDLGLPDSAGLESLRRLLATAPDVPIIVLTATDDELLATQAMQEGALDYIPKSAATAELLERLLRATLRGSDGVDS